MATVFSSRRGVNRAELQRRVRHPLQSLRGYIRGYILMEGIGLAFLYLTLWYWIGLMLDWGCFHLFSFDWLRRFNSLEPSGWQTFLVRGGTLIVVVSGLIALVAWKLVLRLTREFSDPALALVLERRFPRQL